MATLIYYKCREVKNLEFKHHPCISLSMKLPTELQMGWVKIIVWYKINIMRDQKLILIQPLKQCDKEDNYRLIARCRDCGGKKEKYAKVSNKEVSII